MSCGCGGGFGVQLSPQPLTLTRFRDFEVKMVAEDESGNSTAIPAGQYLFELYTEPVKTVWPFVVSGSAATLKVESVEADKVPDRTKFQLVHLPPGELEGGRPMALGVVRRQG